MEEHLLERQQQPPDGIDDRDRHYDFIKIERIFFCFLWRLVLIVVTEDGAVDVVERGVDGAVEGEDGSVETVDGVVEGEDGSVETVDRAVEASDGDGETVQDIFKSRHGVLGGMPDVVLATGGCRRQSLRHLGWTFGRGLGLEVDGRRKILRRSLRWKLGRIRLVEGRLDERKPEEEKSSGENSQEQSNCDFHF